MIRARKPQLYERRRVISTLLANRSYRVTMPTLFRRFITRLHCRVRGHRLSLVRPASGADGRVFYCQCCRERFVLTEQRRWHRFDTAVAPLRQGH